MSGRRRQGGLVRETKLPTIKIRSRSRELKVADHQSQIVLNIFDDVQNVTVSWRIENCDIAKVARTCSLIVMLFQVMLHQPHCLLLAEPGSET